MPRKKLPARQNEPSFPQQRHANPRACKPMKAREEMQRINKFMENVDSQEWPESHHPGPPPSPTCSCQGALEGSASRLRLTHEFTVCPLSQPAPGIGEPAGEDAGCAAREGEGPLAAVPQEGPRVQPGIPAAGFLLAACLGRHGAPLTFTRFPDVSRSAWDMLHFCTGSPASPGKQGSWSSYLFQMRKQDQRGEVTRPRPSRGARVGSWAHGSPREKGREDGQVKSTQIGATLRKPTPVFF